MPDQDTRWKQRLDHYRTALSQLGDAVDLASERPLSDLEKQGLIQAFEFTHELAWNTLRDFFSYQGNIDIHGSRDASREAFRQGLIEDGDTWMSMIKSRNMSSHTYNKKTAEEIINAILNNYYSEFIKLRAKLETLATGT